jgi:hypothetical protein
MISGVQLFCNECSRSATPELPLVVHYLMQALAFLIHRVNLS